MKLGELLVRDQRITEDQLAQAMATQARDGGRLGSILIESGLIDAELLTVYLGLELGLPIASGPTLERCKRSAVILLSPEQAAEFRAVPIVIQGQTLLVAMHDPHDLQTLDAIAKATGYRIIPRVAPEIRVYYYMERYYGVARPQRFEALGDTPRGDPNPKKRADLPAPPLPGLPPQHELPTPPMAQLIHIRRLEAVVPPPPPAMASAGAKSKELQSDAADLTDALEACDEQPAVDLDAEHLIEESVPEEVEAAGSTQAADAADDGDDVDDGWGDAEDVPLAAATTTAKLPVPSFEDTLETIDQAENRGNIADAVLDYCRGTFATAVLFLVRDQIAFGWKSAGKRHDQASIEALLVPLEAPSVFQMAIHNKGLFQGKPSPSAIHKHLAKVLGSPESPHCTVGLMEISGRPVNVLYCEYHGIGKPSDEDMAALRKVMKAAEAAYVRLISQRKSKRTEPTTTSPN